MALGGDVHTNFVADLKLAYSNAKSPIVATEICSRSIFSDSLAQIRIDAAAVQSAHSPWPRRQARPRHGRADKHGHVRLRLDAKELTAQLRVVDDALDPARPGRTWRVLP